MHIKKLTVEECRHTLKENRIGRLACARDNQPYVVPFQFVIENDFLYSFSTFGRKIEWMRTNPLVCVEVDGIKNQFEWTSFVIFGRFEELFETPEFEEMRIHAFDLLSRYPMWWEPGFVTGTHNPDQANITPIYFRIHIETISGHRAVSD